MIKLNRHFVLMKTVKLYDRSQKVCNRKTLYPLLGAYNVIINPGLMFGPCHFPRLSEYERHIYVIQAFAVFRDWTRQRCLLSEHQGSSHKKRRLCQNRVALAKLDMRYLDMLLHYRRCG